MHLVIKSMFLETNRVLFISQSICVGNKKCAFGKQQHVFGNQQLAFYEPKKLDRNAK
jgi:hypothetical protein